MKRQSRQNTPKPPCSMPQPDCFARNGRGRCTALENTDFHDKACPFYKTTEQEAADRATALERLEALGREDLIALYRVKKSPGGKSRRNADVWT